MERITCIRLQLVYKGIKRREYAEEKRERKETP
jgi:hypothetical protein